MEEIVKETRKLSIRSTNKNNVERKRLPSEKDIEHDKKYGLFSSIRRLFSSDSKHDDNWDATSRKSTASVQLPPTLPPTIEDPVEIFRSFHPFPHLQLPVIEDCTSYMISLIVITFKFHAEMPSNFMDNCSLTTSQRSRVIVYMAERHGEFAQPLESFHLAVYMVDRLLQTKLITTDNAELMCISALSLAAKSERQVGLKKEILRSFSHSKRQLYEAIIFRAMGFVLGQHTVIHIMRILGAAIFANVSNADKDVQAWNAAKVISQLAVMDSSLVGGTKPSLLAAAVLRLSLALIDRPWLDSYTAQSQHCEDDILRKTVTLYKLIKKTFDADRNAIIKAIDSNLSSSEFIRNNLHNASKMIE